MNLLRIPIPLGLTIASLCCAAAQDTSPTNQFRTLFDPGTICSQPPGQLLPFVQGRFGTGFEVTFVEEKRIQLLQRPLRSAGEIVCLPGQGLYRRLTKPLQQELLISREFIAERDNAGKISRLPIDKQPPVRGFVEAFLAIFSGSWTQLVERFEIHFQADAKGWQLGLRPTQAPMSKIISMIVIEGDQEILSRLYVIESNGDWTKDDFADLRFLSPDQANERHRLFDWPTAAP